MTTVRKEDGIVTVARTVPWQWLGGIVLSCGVWGVSQWVAFNRLQDGQERMVVAMQEMAAEIKYSRDRLAVQDTRNERQDVLIGENTRRIGLLENSIKY